MNVIIEQPLADYLNRRGYAAIVVDLVESRSCCTGLAELSTSFAAPDKARTLEKKAVRTIDAGPYALLIMARGLEYDDEIVCSLSNFLGLKDVKIKGIRAFSI